MNKEELIASSEKNIIGTYRRQPVVFVRGEGAHLWDTEGKEYVDFVAGIAVCSLGHSHPKVVEAICRQAGTLMHVSNLYYTEPQIRLAEMLVENSFADRVFFCNSGAEANEAAIKLARKYGHDNLKGRYEILTMKGSFHGRTLAAITATGQEKFHVGFSPLPEGFRYVPFNDVKALEKAVSKKTCAVLLEPIQGEGGVRVPDEGYLRAVREICDRKGILMILDEVQTGMGRTGKLFGYEHYGATARHHDAGQGPGERRSRGGSRRDGEGRGQLRPGNPRLHLRRKPACHGGGDRDAGDDPGGGISGELPEDGRIPAGAALVAAEGSPRRPGCTRQGAPGRPGPHRRGQFHREGLPRAGGSHKLYV